MSDFRVCVQQLTQLQVQHGDSICTTLTVPLVVMTSVRQQRSVCDLASFFGSRHSSSILATQRRKASSESELTKQGCRGNGRAHSSGLNTQTHTCKVKTEIETERDTVNLKSGRATCEIIL